MALIAAAWLLHIAAIKHDSVALRSAIPFEKARIYFPTAAKVVNSGKSPDDVLDAEGRHLGFICTSSPEADSIIGYSGPNNVLIALNSTGEIIGAELLASSDTEAHVKEIRAATSFWKQFAAWTPSHESPPKIAAVGGSTLTSLGIAEAMQKRLAGRVDSLRFPEPLKLKEIQQLFPTAQSFGFEKDSTGWHFVKDKDGRLLGFAVRTSPHSDYTFGHGGPTESLIAVAPDRNTLLGVRVRRSYDTDDYVDSVKEDIGYLNQLTNFSVQQWANMDLKKSGLEGVSGATETSFAVADGIRRRFAADARETKPSFSFKARDWALASVVFGSLLMTFTRLRGMRRIRIVWQLVLIGLFGLLLGDLLSLAMLTGWARNGIAWKTAPSLVLMAAFALLIPWATRQQFYCFQLCPHGAAQEWLGRFQKLHLRLPEKAGKWLRLIPALLLGTAFFIAMISPTFNLAALEPFDAWAMRGTLLVATVIAIVGLIASLFVPMAYCRFGCPTGALLKFMRSTGSGDHFAIKDIAAALLLLIGAVMMVGPGTVSHANGKTASVELHGPAFGTTWSIKIRHCPYPSDVLQKELAAEMERIESTLSHWRSNSATAKFNAAGTTQPIEMPAELLGLIERCQNISRTSDGAYDITVAPLVKAWGFGPGNLPRSAPTDEEIARLRLITGWQKLRADKTKNTLQKDIPDLQIDLGSILQGYAADRVAAILQQHNLTEYLINVGGELLAKGTWRVAVESPAHPSEPLRIIELKDAALATSGTYRATHKDAVKQWSHVINPQTGRPIEHSTSLVSVISHSCADADAWATALLVLGGEKAKAMAATNQLSILIVTGGDVSDWHFPPTTTP